jgi:hypothetical protein
MMRARCKHGVCERARALKRASEGGGGGEREKEREREREREREYMCVCVCVMCVCATTVTGSGSRPPSVFWPGPTLIGAVRGLAPGP